MFFIQNKNTMFNLFFLVFIYVLFILHENTAFYLYVLLLRTQNETLQLCVKELKPSKSFIENSFLFLGCFLIC